MFVEIAKRFVLLCDAVRPAWAQRSNIRKIEVSFIAKLFLVQPMSYGVFARHRHHQNLVAVKTTPLAMLEDSRPILFHAVCVSSSPSNI